MWHLCAPRSIRELAKRARSTTFFDAFAVEIAQKKQLKERHVCSRDLHRFELHVLRVPARSGREAMCERSQLAAPFPLKRVWEF